MNIQPITFEKKYKKPRTGKREIQKTQSIPKMPKMNQQECVATLEKQANLALVEAQKIKQNANSVKIRSFEIADKAKKNKEFADSLYYEIKENPNSSSKNFVVQHQGTTYKVENTNGKYRAIGQSRGFFGKKDVFEYEMKKGELVTTILKGYSKEKGADTYTVQEEYHFFEDRWLEVFFETTTNEYKKSKEKFTFILGNQLYTYATNSKTKPNDYSCGEFDTLINYDSIGKLSYCSIGLNNISKSTSVIKRGYHFYCDKLSSYFKDCYIKEKGENYDCNNGIMIQFRNNQPEVGYINYHVINERPKADFEYRF